MIIFFPYFFAVPNTCVRLAWFQLEDLKIMPRYSKNKTLREIKKFSKPGVYAIGYVPGLAVRVNASLGAAYVFRYQVRGLDRTVTIGNIKIIDLKSAVSTAMQYKVMLLNDQDPVQHKRARKAEMLKKISEEQQNKAKISKSSFYIIANEYLQYRKESGAFDNNVKAESNAGSMLINHVYPYIRDQPIDDVTSEDICMALSKIWKDRPSLSNKVIGLLKQIFDYAIAKKYYDRSNPALLTGPLKTLLEPYNLNRSGSQHFASLDFHELPELMLELWQKNTLAAKGVMFSILTAARSKPVRYLTWDQLDMKHSCWEIPLENDKSKRTDANRTIFLSPQAKNLLRTIARRVDLVFTNSLKLNALSDAAFGKVLRDINAARRLNGKPPFTDKNIKDEQGCPTEITQHGTARATFKTWAKDDELGNNRRFYEEAVEMCLLHSRKDPLKGAYDRTKLEKERRQIMDAWGKFCCSKIPELNK